MTNYIAALSKKGKLQRIVYISKKKKIHVHLVAITQFNFYVNFSNFSSYL